MKREKGEIERGRKREKRKSNIYIYERNSLSYEEKKTACILFTEMGYALGLFVRLSGITWLCPSGNGEMPVLFGDIASIMCFNI